MDKNLANPAVKDQIKKPVNDFCRQVFETFLKCVH